MLRPDLWCLVGSNSWFGIRSVLFCFVLFPFSSQNTIKPLVCHSEQIHGQDRAEVGGALTGNAREERTSLRVSEASWEECSGKVLRGCLLSKPRYPQGKGPAKEKRSPQGLCAQRGFSRCGLMAMDSWGLECSLSPAQQGTFAPGVITSAPSPILLHSWQSASCADLCPRPSFLTQSKGAQQSVGAHPFIPELLESLLRTRSRKSDVRSGTKAPAYSQSHILDCGFPPWSSVYLFFFSPPNYSLPSPFGNLTFWPN